jgi:hypothetical protein
MPLHDLLADRGIDVSSLRVLCLYQEQPIWTLAVPRAQALSRWTTLRELVPLTGHWPVIGWDRTCGPWESLGPQQIIDRGVGLDVDDWLASARAASAVAHGAAARALGPTGSAGSARQGYPPFAFRIHEHARFPFILPPSTAPIALVPVDAGWKVPAYLEITFSDAWDTAPPARLPTGDRALDAVAPWGHIAMLKRWHERYGAELVAATSGQMELSVQHPPATYEAALALAGEQYVYCPDLVEQEVGSLTALATLLVGSPVWRFWWD